jgi:hypothetical protein
MLLVPVISSNLAAIGYDEISGEMQIQFLNGRIYSYQNVPPDVYMGLVNAPSKGQYFGAMIRNQPGLYLPLRIL